MEEQLKKTDASLPNYQFYTKKVEKILTVIFMLLFFVSFSQSMFSIYTIAFYGFALIVLLYYFIYFRKKKAYVIIKDDSIIVSRGFFLKSEEIKNIYINKVNILDKKIGISFIKDGTEDVVSIFNILLENKDKDAIISYLRSIKP